MQFKLVNILKQTITESETLQKVPNYDTVEFSFGSMKPWKNKKGKQMWYVFFNDVEIIDGEYKYGENVSIFLKGDGEYLLINPEYFQYIPKTKSASILLNVLKKDNPNVEYKLFGDEDGNITHNFRENLDVNTLKKKASGVPETILQALKETYPNNWGKISEPDCETDYGVLDIFPAIPGERWSILNFFDTNPGVIGLLVNKYKIENDSQTKEGFRQWILDNKEELFGENSSLLPELVKRNLQSFERGWKLESAVIDIIKRDYPFITDEDIVQYCLGSNIDRYNGKDLIVKGKGIQIKPSPKMARGINGEIKVITYGMKDWYKMKPDIDYIIYSNGKDIAVFPNKNYWVSNDGNTAIHYEKMVPNPFV